MTKSSLPVIVALIVLLIPALQCLRSLRNISRLNSAISESKIENERLLTEIGNLNNSKAAALGVTARKLGELDGCLSRNKELLAKTEQAEQKMRSVKALIEEYRTIGREIDQIRHTFPELTSGP